MHLKMLKAFITMEQIVKYLSLKLIFSGSNLDNAWEILDVCFSYHIFMHVPILNYTILFTGLHKKYAKVSHIAKTLTSTFKY